MDSENKNQYLPDYVSPPGETIQDVLKTLGMSQAELAERTGRSQKTINEIIKGKAPITPDTAIQFERVFGIAASFWNSRENKYREYIAKRREEDRLESEVDWLNNFPINDLIKLGWLNKADGKPGQLRRLLQYFGIVNPKQWESFWLESQTVSYRQSKAFRVDPYALACWLRQGEINAKQVKLEQYDHNKFKNALVEIRKLTVENSGVYTRRMVDLCSDCGVAVVFIHELPKIRAFGVTRWLSSDKALIQLCLRYKTNDHFWFTFFHEVGHILLHGKRDVFIEEGNQDEKESEADTYASEALIPYSDWRPFVARKCFRKSDVLEFSNRIGIQAGIIVGRLQHEERIPYDQLNYLKFRLRWTTDN